MTLPEIGVRRPTATLMAFLLVLILGLVSYFQLPIDLFPDLELPAVTVVTTWPGANAEDIETKVTRLIEKQLSTVNNLDEITSETSEGISRITCTFLWGTDISDAAADVRDRLEFAKRNLPDDVEQPVVYKFSSSSMPIINFGISANESWEKLYEIIDNNVARPLQRIDGVGAVQLRGGLQRQINITLRRDKMAAYDLSLTDLQSYLSNENLTLPAGTLKIGTVEYTLRVPGEYRTPEEVKYIPLFEKNGAIVRLLDVAEVSDGFEEVTQLVETDRAPGMMMSVQKRSGANTVSVARSVLSELEVIQKNIPSDIKITVMTDTSDFIIKSIQNVSSTLLWGGVFVIFITFLFLRSLRTSGVIALTIPFSLIIAFAFIYLMDWTLNLVSMAALSIAIGMVVDNAVVVLENISTHVERGAKVYESAMYGASEMASAITASTMTTVVVFVPMIFLDGVEGIMFMELAGIITVTLLASLVCSLILTPMLASKFMLSQTEIELSMHGLNGFLYRISEKFFLGIEFLYGMIIKGALKVPSVVLIVATAFLGASVMLIPFIGTEFSPDQDDGELSITVQLPVSTRVERTADFCRQTVDLIYDCAERVSDTQSIIKVISWRCGASQSPFGGLSESNIARFQLRLISMTERKQSSKALGAAISAELKKYPEVEKISVSTGNRMMNGMSGGQGKPIQVEVYGHNLEHSKLVANQIRDIALTTLGATDPTLSLDRGNREFSIMIDRDRAAVLGVNMRSIATTLRTLFYGNEATQYREGEYEYKVFVQLDECERCKMDDVLNTEIDLGSGRRIRLDAIASIVETEGPIRIERKNQERVIKVEIDNYQRSVGKVVADIQDRIYSEISLPDDVQIAFGGTTKEQTRTFRNLSLALILGIVMVYMVMAAQFESLLRPLIIMFSVPFAFSGVFIALYLTDTTLNMMSFIGVILLIGTVVNNAIVLIDYINLLQARGATIYDAVIASCKSRLRPVLITTLTTIGGMLPLAIFVSEGSEAWRALGITVIGGLSVSTLVTLILVPVLYYLVSYPKKKKSLIDVELLK